MHLIVLLLLALFPQTQHVHTYHRHDNENPEVCPTIVAFSASAASVPKGGMITLTWNVAGAHGVDIRGLRQDVLEEGAESVKIDGPKSFTLSAKGNNCTVESDPIVVKPQ